MKPDTRSATPHCNAIAIGLIPSAARGPAGSSVAKIYSWPLLPFNLTATRAIPYLMLKLDGFASVTCEVML